MLPRVFGDKTPQILLLWGVVLSQSTFHLVLSDVSLFFFLIMLLFSRHAAETELTTVLRYIFGWPVVRLICL